jgi:hypothetical protein
MCPRGGVNAVETSPIANAEDQTPIPWSSSPHPMRCTLMLRSYLAYRTRLNLVQHSVVSQVDSMASLASVFKMKPLNSTSTLEMEAEMLCLRCF